MKTKKSKLVGIIFLISAICVTVFIFHNSSCDASSSAKTSGHLAKFFLILAGKLGFDINYTMADHIVRKCAHFLEFAAQAGCAGLFVIFFYKKVYDKLIYILFTGLFTACTDEFTQLFSLGRSAEIKDVFVDFSGTLTATAVCVLIYVIFKKRLGGDGECQ